jgi:hypothetical protein
MTQNTTGPTASETLSDLGLTHDQLSPEDRSAYDTLTAFDARIAAVLDANGGEVICPRCNRPALGWPLPRADRCSERRAVSCMRDPEVALTDIARRAARQHRTRESW